MSAAGAIGEGLTEPNPQGNIGKIRAMAAESIAAAMEEEKRQEAAKPEAAKPEAAKPEAAKPEAAKAKAAKAKAAKAAGAKRFEEALEKNPLKEWHLSIHTALFHIPRKFKIPNEEPNKTIITTLKEKYNSQDLVSFFSNDQYKNFLDSKDARSYLNKINSILNIPYFQISSELSQNYKLYDIIINKNIIDTDNNDSIILEFNGQQEIYLLEFITYKEMIFELDAIVQLKDNKTITYIDKKQFKNKKENIINLFYTLQKIPAEVPAVPPQSES